jgi:hypothetical protein
MAEKSKGFVIVASKKRNFYVYAINLIESIRDFYEDANIALVTEEKFVDSRAHDLADHIIHCDDHYRAKLWGMTQSPYDLTMYIDADMECEHEDIAKVFDEIKDHDVVFSALTRERDYIYAERDFDTPEGPAEFDLCGGVCLYDMTKPIVKNFIDDWWELTRRQMDDEWWPEGYADSLKSWDQFSLWWLVNKEDKYKDLKVGIFEDDMRWNYYNAWNWAKTRPEGEVILRHYSCGLNKDETIV